MYILEVNHGGGEIHRHFLLPGQTYTLGRKECRILLPAAEPSISRHHATIVVAPMPRYSVLDPSAQLEIRIEDISKHGTFVDRERVGKDNTRFLYPEDRIRLGLRVTARIIPMVLVVGISPDLTDKSLDAVLDAAVHIGALVVEDAIPPPLQYYEHHTNCVGFLYVAEENFAMEETMMQALGYGYTLVTPDYILRLVRSLEERDTLMPGEFPTPSSPSPASLGLRAVHYRRPAQTFFSVTEFLSIGKPIIASVFRGYTFLVVDETIGDAYAAVLRLFGGTVEALEMDDIAQWRSQHPQTGAYPMTTCVVVAEDDFRVLSEEVMERGGGRGIFPTTHLRPHITGYLSLYKFGVCLIPEENVHLSLYRNDEKELNTKSTACYLQRTTEDVQADTVTTSSTSPADDTATTPTTTTTSPSPAAAAAAAAPSAPETSARQDNGPSRVSESPSMSPPATSAITHLVPVHARRARDISHAPSSSPQRAESAENAASMATTSTPAASPASPPVTVLQDVARTSSPPHPSPARSSPRESSATASVPTPATAPNAPATSFSASLTSQPVPPTPTPAPATTFPPALDSAKLSSNTIVPSHLNPASSGSSTAPPDTNSVTTSNGATPTAVAKVTASSPRAQTSTSVPTFAAVTDPTTAATAAASSLTDIGGSVGSDPNDAGMQGGRGRLVGARASHPFSLGLRARHSDVSNNHNNNNNTDDDDGDVQDGATIGKETGNSEDANAGATTSTSQTRRVGPAATRRASVSGRRPSLGAQPSPVMLPLKSEEVVRPRSRAASGSPQSAYAAAVAALGRRSIGRSEERLPLAPAEEEQPQHRTTVEVAQRRSSGSMELGSQAMPPMLPPPTPPASTAATAASITTASSPAPSTSPAPLLQRALPKSSTASAATTPTAASSGAAFEKTASSGGGGGAAPSHASVRRGEQRLASASVPTPRRSLVRVHPVLAAVHHERSASPQQTHAKLKRFTTPERDVVVHGATQVGKSPPRQRVEAVRISAAASERRSSVSRDYEASLSRHADPLEEDSPAAGSMGNRRSVLRRESVSAVNRPLPSSGSVTRRASSSFHRSDSAQLREMATPHRLATSRVSSSVPRTRRSKVYGSVQRQRSPELGNEDAAAAMDAGAFSSGPLGTAGLSAAQRVSIRRRRSSPTQGNGAGLAGATVVAAAAKPGQIPGLRGSSAAPVLGGTSNATAETYFRINDELNAHCQKFMTDFIDDFMSDTERVTRSVVRQTYMDAPSKEVLESGVGRILEFLQYVNSTEPDIPSMYSTSSTRAACHQVRQKSQYTLSKIKACYKTVNCKIPSSLTRARAALSTRNVSPTQRRLNSVAGVHETSSGRRQSTF